MTETPNAAVLRSEAWWETGSSVRYMTQLCKHFAHRLEVTLNERDAQIVFSSGVCDVTAEETGLRMCVAAEDEAGLEQLQSVVISHLQRFAFRDMTEEDAAAIVWTRF